MIGTEIGDPGQRALDDVTALDLAPLELEFLDAEETLHRVGETGTAQELPGGEFFREFGDERRIVGVRRVPNQRVLAPRHESGGAADFAERRDRLDGATQIGRAILRLTAAPGPDVA